MKAKDVRKMLMNNLISTLRQDGPFTHAQLLRVLQPSFAGLNEATLAAALTARLNELIDRDFIQTCPPNPEIYAASYFAPADRMFDANGNWIGHTLIDPEWPT
jgi:hypothetical protein